MIKQCPARCMCVAYHPTRSFHSGKCVISPRPMQRLRILAVWTYTASIDLLMPLAKSKALEKHEWILYDCLRCLKCVNLLLLHISTPCLRRIGDPVGSTLCGSCSSNNPIPRTAGWGELFGKSFVFCGRQRTSQPIASFVYSATKYPIRMCIREHLQTEYHHHTIYRALQNEARCERIY
jgi:hypothetical protein